MCIYNGKERNDGRGTGEVIENDEMYGYHLQVS